VPQMDGWIERTHAKFHILAILRDKTVQVACVSYEMFNCTAHLEQVLSALYQESMCVLCIMDVRCITVLPLSFIYFFIHTHSIIS